MRTAREPESEPDANQGSTRGVRKLKPRVGRPRPYGVQWSEFVFSATENALVREVKTSFFPTEHLCDAKYGELVRDKRKGALQTASRSELNEYRSFKAATEGASWQSVVAGWRAHLSDNGLTPCAINVEKAVTEYLTHCLKLKDQEKLSADNYRHKKTKLGLFADQFGDLPLDGVPPEEIELLIDDIETVNSPVTFDNYIKHFSAMFGYFIKAKKITSNACDEVEYRSDGIGEVKIISPAQTAQLFHTALTYRSHDGSLRFKAAIGRLALEAFVGLRFSSGTRVAKSEINFEDKGITLPRKKLKTEMGRHGRRRYIDQLPDQVWEWLAITPEECWEITPRTYMRLKSELFVAATVPHPRNCFRHNFATYDVAAHKNPGRTATILCHTDQEELWEHYNGVATHKMGVLYQQITPKSCARIARGFVPAAPKPAPVELPIGEAPAAH